MEASLVVPTIFTLGLIVLVVISKLSTRRDSTSATSSSTRVPEPAEEVGLRTVERQDHPYDARAQEEMADPRERATWERTRAAQKKMHDEKRFSVSRDESTSPVGESEREEAVWTALRGDGEPAPGSSTPADSRVSSPHEMRSAPVAEDSGRQVQKRRWAAVRARFRDAQLRAAQYELDPALAIDYPAFNDVTVPEVSAMVKTFRTASHLRDTVLGAPIGGSKELLVEFEAAMRDYETAIDIAERAARRLRWSHLPQDDAKDLHALRNLLAHAENPGNTDEARQGYYAQLQKVARRLNDRHGAPLVPTGALAAIEAQARRQIEG